MLSMVDDVPVDSEASVMTSSISRIAGSVFDVPIDSEVSVMTSSISRICRLSLLRRCYRGRVCVHVFIEGDNACVVSV